MQFKVGDIVKYRYPDCDDVIVCGVITLIENWGCYTVFWFDEQIYCEHERYQLSKVC